MGDATEKFEQFRSHPEVKPILDRTPIETSQSGGKHIYYKCPIISGNQKTAQYEIKDQEGKTKVETLIETRGEGGFIVCAPSEGYKLLQGDFGNIPTITEEERNILLSHAKSFNTYFGSVENNKYTGGKTEKNTP